jgi:RNA-binding protein
VLFEGVILELSSGKRRALKAQAHAIKCIIRIGAAGLWEGVIHELDQGLKSHELIKIKVFSDERETRTILLEKICERLDAAPVQHIGKVLVIYRLRPDNAAAPDIPPPDNRKKKTSRRNKRSSPGIEAR